MDTRGLPSSTTQANYQRVPSLSSAANMDPSYHNNNNASGGYVYPSSSYDNNSNTNGSSQLQHNQSPFRYPEHQEHPTNGSGGDHNQLSSSAPLRLEGVDGGYDDSMAGLPAVDAHLLSITPPGKVLLLQTLTTLSTILFTVLPVVIKAGSDATWGHWYGWRDAVRVIEPFFSGLLHSWFFYSSDLMRRWTDDRRSNSWGDVALEDKQQQGRNHQQGHNNSLPSTAARRKPSSWKETTTFRAFLANVFTFFLIVYVTGAAIHAAAAFFKNIIVLFLEQYSQGIGLSTHPPTAGDGQLPMALASQLKEGYLLIQDTWEHNVSHYMYALGALGMSWCEMVAYSGQILPVGVNLARVGQISSSSRMGVRSKKSSKRLVFLWILAGVLYGGIVAGVACQYPKGLYVGIAYVAVLFLVLVTYILTRPTRGLFTLGRHYILQTYLIGTVVAAVAIVIYLAVHHFEFLTSNDKSHLDSINRP